MLCPAVFFVLDRARACALQSSAGLLCAQLLCYARAAPRGVRCAASEAEVRALAATLKKGPAASASARTATAGGGASGAGASGAGARGTAPPIDDDLSNKNIEVCFSITYKERGKKEVTENFWCPGTIESVSDESTVLGRKKLGCGWVFVNYRDGEADWQLLRPTFFNAKKPGGWRIVASAAELETNFEIKI